MLTSATPSLTDLVLVARENQFEDIASTPDIALAIFHDIRNHSPLLERLYFRTSSFRFEGGDDEEWLPLTLGASAFAAPLKDAFTILVVHGPCGADWNQVRVILAARGARTNSCPISNLPYNVLQYIVQFMGRGNFLWESPPFSKR